MSIVSWTVGVVLFSGCQADSRPSHHPPLDAGPSFLRGTVGSMVRVRNFDHLLVSGHGLVVNLNGTGSSVVPASIRQKMLNTARKGGLGSARLNTSKLTPERVLLSRDTAVVAVEGLIPPGAVKGSRFDLLVSRLPQTNVTSLTGGALWTAPLSMLGTDPTMDNMPLAEGRGPIYVNPFEDPQAQRQEAPQAVVIGGGVVEHDQKVELVLLQPNYNRARAIADRINEQFHHEKTTEVFNTAMPLSDSTIRINVPQRYGHNPQQLISLILHLFTGRGPNYEIQKAKQLAQILASQPHHADDVVLAWVALGPTTKPVLRKYYEHPKRTVSLSALEAGAKLADELTTPVLGRLARDDDPQLRRRVAEILGYLPRSIRGPKILHSLLDDDQRNVRLAAYKSLDRIGDPIVQRTVFHNDAGFKFLLDLVPSKKPLIYIGQSPGPKFVIFDMMLGFRDDQTISLWDHRLMLRRMGEHQIKVFYQKPGRVEAEQPVIAPTVANLVLLLGHHPTPEHPMAGFDLEFGRVANALYSLKRQGLVDAEVELQVNPLAATLARYRQLRPGQPRPDVGRQVELPPTPGLGPVKAGG